MIELMDNLLQLTVTAIGCVWAGATFYKSRREPFFMLTGFYAAFTLGTLYWTLHIILLNSTPPLFYVSEIGWTASYIFLLALLFTMRTPSEPRQKTALTWLAPVFCVPQFLLYITHGELLYNLAMCIPTMLIGWLAIDGLVLAKRSAAAKEKTAFYAASLLFVVLEYLLWTSSCLWPDGMLANLYFVFDVLLSFCALMLLPTLK